MRQGWQQYQNTEGELQTLDRVPAPGSSDARVSGASLAR
jgi:hypothetical protein